MAPNISLLHVFNTNQIAKSYILNLMHHSITKLKIGKGGLNQNLNL